MSERRWFRWEQVDAGPLPDHLTPAGARDLITAALVAVAIGIPLAFLIGLGILALASFDAGLDVHALLLMIIAFLIFGGMGRR